ncbi:hypothetical protein PV326_001337 [Microctonus aethiopoides]|nr:hypothetical protein PV326_001337 [Microctonus aethiopoides]
MSIFLPSYHQQVTDLLTSKMLRIITMGLSSAIVARGICLNLLSLFLQLYLPNNNRYFEFLHAWCIIASPSLPSPETVAQSALKTSGESCFGLVTEFLCLKEEIAEPG